MDFTTPPLTMLKPLSLLLTLLSTTATSAPVPLEKSALPVSLMVVRTTMALAVPPLAEAVTAGLDPPFATVPAGSGPRHFTFDPGGKHAYVINEILSTITAFNYDPKKMR